MNEKTVKKRPSQERKLHAQVRELILSTRVKVAQAVNAGLTMLYWHIGRRIRQDILKEDRAEYGAKNVFRCREATCHSGESRNPVHTMFRIPGCRIGAGMTARAVPLKQ